MRPRPNLPIQVFPIQSALYGGADEDSRLKRHRAAKRRWRIVAPPDDNRPLARVVMAGRCRLAGYLLTAALISAPMCTALAQSPEGAQPSGACYQVLAGRAGSRPAGTILLNRCSGQTWMLIQARQSVADGIDGGQVAYRWSPIATADTQVAVNPSRPAKIFVPRPASPNNAKCFTFQGRKYCE
jgi:hypothetical protein